MKKFNLIAIGAMLLTTNIYGQDAYDALRLSTFNPGGTARTLGLGGAAGAIGGDQGSVEINPAAIGFYRKSELTISPDLVIGNSSTNMAGNTATDGRVDFNLANAGLVITRLLDGRRGFNTGKWQSVNFGFTFNKIADFNSARTYYDPNTTNSVLADYKNEINSSGITPSAINNSNLSLGTIAAYNAYLLNPTANDSAQYTSVTDGATVAQNMVIHTRGSISELGFTFGTNWNNMIYFAGAIDIPIVNYHEDVLISENALTGGTPSFTNFTQQNILNTTGAGINAKFGVIYRPISFFRVGATIYTPTYYHLTDNYSVSTIGNFDSTIVNNSGTVSGPTQASTFDYRLTTPFRFVGSVAGFFKQYGFLSADYEYANYSNASYQYNSQFSQDQSAVNQMIASTLKTTHTIRVGLELAPVSIFRLRGGFSYTTSPIQSSQQIDGGNYVLMAYSGGFGFRFHRVFLDFAYIRYKTNTATVFASNVAATNNLKQDNVVMTLGFNFGSRHNTQQTTTYSNQGNQY